MRRREETRERERFASEKREGRRRYLADAAGFRVFRFLLQLKKKKTQTKREYEHG